MKLIAIAIIFMVVLSIIPLIQIVKASDTTVSIDPSDQELSTAYVGQTIKIDIKVNDVQTLWSWNINNLTFNPEVLNLTEITEGPFLKTGGQTLFIWTSNSPKVQNGTVPEISDILLENNSISGSGVIASLNFKVVSAGTSQIMLNSTKLLTPYEITPSFDTVTGVYQEINGTSVNGKLTINALSTYVRTPNNDSGMPLYLVIIIVVVVAIAVSTVAVILVRKRR